MGSFWGLHLLDPLGRLSQECSFVVVKSISKWNQVGHLCDNVLKLRFLHEQLSNKGFKLCVSPVAQDG